MKTIAAGIIVAALLGCFGCATMPPKPASFAREDYSYTKDFISRVIKREMKKNDVAGLSIALVDDRQIIWAEGFGWADEGNAVPATPDTVYRVGSISKLLTATATMQLAEQGRVDIDKPLQRTLPEFVLKSRFAEGLPITPRTLMTHHSGVPSDLHRGMWTKNPEPFGAVMDRLREEYAANPPNTVYAYSNLGVTLLGLAVEKAAGDAFVSHMDASLLRPLGMTRSSFSSGCDRSSFASKAYRDGKEVVEPALRDLPAGGLNSTARDLARFIQMVFGGGKIGERRIIDPETLAEMLRPQNGDVPLDLNFRVGLGWHLSGLGLIDIRNAGPVAHHSGATINHRAMLIVLPEHKLGVVVLSNSAASGRVVNRVAVETLQLALEAKTGIRQPDRKAPPERGDTPPAEALQGYEGRYATIVGVVPVSNKTSYLRAEVVGKPVRLIPRADGLLGLQYKLFGLIPISLGELNRAAISRATIAGRDILKIGIDGQEMILGERIHPAPIPAAWERRLGRYEIINAGDDHVRAEGVCLKDDNGFLVIDVAVPLWFKGTVHFALKPISDTEAVISGLGRGMGETIAVVTRGNEELLRYSGYLLRKQVE
jgi:CubicO group peptidase (beta-lactamase class C family)